ncbi:hypothetical protein M378DRAFT_185916 [Amanita muscaria Koide BX008]|uniref:Pre-rRNA-processing protein TSR2 n=1 Tax=Amanita muscaria (strain Koide BX008) TaxID=946122 RepID=A0A0C2XCF8_AMAMK|nr:hypothetical protein M378DRAFT_185916 [Amanita muscaria Koide BX008]
MLKAETTTTSACTKGFFTHRRPASLVLFASGVIACLEIWSILRIAVQEGWGGPKSADKRTWLASEIVDTFQQQASPPDDQYVEELLLQVMEDEFDCIVEDEKSQSGKKDAILKFEESARKLKGKRIDTQISSEENEDVGDDDEWEDESGDEEMRVDEAPQLSDHCNQNEPQVDENGFVLVKRKGKGRR